MKHNDDDDRDTPSLGWEERIEAAYLRIKAGLPPVPWLRNLPTLTGIRRQVRRARASGPACGVRPSFFVPRRHRRGFTSARMWIDRRIAAAFGELGRPAHDYTKRLAIKGDGRVILVDVDEVDRLEAAGNYVEVHSGARRHLVRETMASLEARLDPARFVRVSRSSIVNADHVRELQPMFNGDFVVVLRDGTKVAGSRRYRVSFDMLTRSPVVERCGCRLDTFVDRLQRNRAADRGVRSPLDPA
jgi:LytTr DNA-binding domain